MDKPLNHNSSAEILFGGSKKHIVLLIDPDKHSPESIIRTLDLAESLPIDHYFLGGSLLSRPLSPILHAMREASRRKIILFPGSNMQLDVQADGLLFLSLLSGRNPEFLIGQHVQAAPLLYQSALEIVPTGYILIEGGSVSSVEYMSNTRPIPANKPEIAVATALAGQYLGLKTIYLEAGSGAKNPVPEMLIRQVKQHIELPLIVGGGIRTAQAARNAFRAGADTIVLGTIAEKSLELLQDICLAKTDYL